MYFSEPFSRFQAWIDLLLIANFSDSMVYVRGIKVEVRRGQVAKSQIALAERWKWSRGKVQRFLDDLQTGGQIRQQKNRLITLISIVNFDMYQQDGQQTEQQTELQTGQQTGQLYKEGQEEYIKETSLTRGKEIRAAAATLSSGSHEPQASESAKDDKVSQVLNAEKVPFAEIIGMWNATCTSFPKLHKLSESRKNKMRCRIEDMGGVDKALPLLQTVFEKVQSSPFLKGDNKRGWKANFDWLLENDKNWVKVYEGNYDQHAGQASNFKNCNDEWI